MNIYHCKNYANCGNSVEHRGELCSSCKNDARTLDHKVEYTLRLDNLYIPKQDGQHRRRDKRGRR